MTGHTVYTKFLIMRDYGAQDAQAAPPTSRPGSFGPAAPGDPTMAPTAMDEGGMGDSVQAECVAWFDGSVLDVRPKNESLPDVEGHGRAGENWYFSDTDELRRLDEGGWGPDAAGDATMQDYDPGYALSSCMPGSRYVPPGAALTGSPTDFAALAGLLETILPATPWSPEVRWSPDFAVLVEKGDCRPSQGHDFRFRGRLDFVDPNGIYHEVQEYDYVCPATHSSAGPAGSLRPGLLPNVPYTNTGSMVADPVKSLFPLTYTDPFNRDGCRIYTTPAHQHQVDPQVDPGEVNVSDPAASELPQVDPNAEPGAVPGHFDLGHRCNGSVQDLVTERMWITRVHDKVFDRTIRAEYNFALVADTCSGLPVTEANDVGRMSGTALGARDVDGLDWYLDTIFGYLHSHNQRAPRGVPLVEICHDGSGYSFDDTSRDRAGHHGPPLFVDIMYANSYQSDPNKSNFGMHRANCRNNFLAWPYNEYPGPHQAPRGPLGLLGATPRQPVQDDCYPEDHKVATADVYTYDYDPTGGLWALHARGLTGPNAYITSAASGPDYAP